MLVREHFFEKSVRNKLTFADRDPGNTVVILFHTNAVFSKNGSLTTE